jgi:hypothetical protein
MHERDQYIQRRVSISFRFRLVRRARRVVGGAVVVVDGAALLAASALLGHLLGVVITSGGL